MKKTLGSLALAVLVAVPATAAGYHYRTVTRSEGNTEQGPIEIRTEAWVADGKTKVLFESSGNPMMPAGSYLLIPDPTTRKMFMVNPEQKTYSEWDLDAMVQFAGSMMEALGPIASFEILNPKVETILEQDGGSKFGLSLTHYRFRTTYDMSVKVLGMKRKSTVTQITDGYYTKDLDDEAFEAWLRPMKTGSEELDKLIGLEMGKNRGFPIDNEIEQTTVNKKGKEEVTRSSMKVTEFGPANPGDELWLIPDDYTLTPMAFPTAAGMPPEGEGAEGEDGGKKKKGLLGRIRGDG
jgi:hypothetical protein